MKIALRDECGVTRISLENFNLLKEKYGTPSTIHASYTEEVGYEVSMEWENGFSWAFTGLSWGYGGEGCQGFKNVLVGCGFNCDISYVKGLGKETNTTWDFA